MRVIADFINPAKVEFYCKGLYVSETEEKKCARWEDRNRQFVIPQSSSSDHGV